jgi:predicted transcriptional regulator
MKEVLINQLDDQDFNNIELLRSLGIKRTVAHVIIYMANKEKKISKDIEIATGLRQPQVSLAMRQLRKNSWVEEEYAKKIKGMKGRPRKIYNLNISINEILDKLTIKKYDEYMKAINTIENLKFNLFRS